MTRASNILIGVVVGAASHARGYREDATQEVTCAAA